MATTLAERVALYRQRHPERIAAYKAANSKRQGAERRSKYPERIRASWAKYRMTEKYRVTFNNNHLKRNYGITYVEYLAMLEAQGGVCKICLGPNTRKSKRRDQLRPLFVDHCHKTGKVRGLLCNNCNAGIARFRDDPEVMSRAIAYVKET